MNKPVNLAEIIGREDHDAQRVVDFMIRDSRLQVGECCDEYFGVVLNIDELNLLIDWLIQARDELGEVIDE